MMKLLFTFVLIAFAATPCAVGMPSGGALSLGGSMRAPAAILGAITLTETQFGMGALALVVLLIGYHFTIGKYIRQQAGVKDAPSETRIVEQPVKAELTNSTITVEGKVEFVPMERFTKLENYIHGMEHDRRGESQTFLAMIEDRRQEAAEQAKDLSKNIDAKFTEAIKANNVTATKIYAKIDQVSDGLRAEIEDKARETRQQINDMPSKLIALLKDTGAIGGRKS